MALGAAPGGSGAQCGWAGSEDAPGWSLWVAPPLAQLQTSRAAQAGPLLAQTILLFVTPAFSGLPTSRLNRILLSNMETCSSLPCLKKRTDSPPLTPYPLQLLPPIPSKRPPESCLLACLSFLPSHVPACPPESGFCPPPSTQTRPSSRWLLPGRQALSPLLSPSPATQRPSPPSTAGFSHRSSPFRA